jgi:hypothetical protein
MTMQDPVKTEFPGLAAINMSCSKFKVRFLVDDELRILSEESPNPKIFFQGNSAYFFKAGIFIASIIYEGLDK